jgi:predicted sugar kinase
MKVEASSYDKIEFSPQYIKPGEFINPPEEIKEIKISATRKIKMRAPSRIDFGVLDHSALKFTDSQDYKAGEMLFACDKYFFAEVELTKNPEIIIKSERKLLVEHIAKMMRKATNYSGGFNIKTKDIKYKHVGLGSSAVSMITVAIAINKLFGNAFSLRELRTLISSNYAEESDKIPNLLFPGTTTGGAFNSIINGGFCITSSDCELIFHEKIPDDLIFIIGMPKLKNKGPETSETEANIINWARHNERVNAAKTALWILMEIMPNFVAGNFAKVGEAFYNFTFFGEKGMQMLFHRQDLAGILFELKEAGLEGGTMSSAGPTLVVFTQSKEKAKFAEEIFAKRGCEQIFRTKGDNFGIVEIKNSDPK